MKTVSILRPATWVGVITLVLGMQAALAEPLVYVPLGGEGKIVVVDAAKDEIVDCPSSKPHPPTLAVRLPTCNGTIGVRVLLQQVSPK